MYVMTFLQFQKELYYISDGIILKDSQKDLRRCEGFQKVLYSAGTRPEMGQAPVRRRDKLHILIFK